VPKADFTSEVRKLPVDPVGIEDYVVRTSDGESVGTVAALLERQGGERLLVVESGAPPLKAVQRAVTWDRVDRVDHDAVAVWLRVAAEPFERESLELDPERAVEQGEGEAEARRLSEPPAELVPAPTEAGRGPVDRPTWAKAFAVFALMAFSVLAATVVVTFAGDNRWALLFLVPALLAAIAAVLGFRAYRRPYEPRGARKP
jgi:hypothetical protein